MAQPEDPRFRHAIAEAAKVQRQLSRLAPTLGAMLGTCQKTYPLNEEPYWSTKLRSDCAQRILILCTEMESVSTLNLLAVCRYAHEIGIWLLLAQKKKPFCLLYGKMQLDSLVEQATDLIRQLEFEARTYNELAEHEEDGLAEAIAQVAERKRQSPSNDIASDFSDQITKIQAETDWRHWSKFMLYRRQAAKHGYRFQADILRTVAIPKVQAELKEHRREADAFSERWPTLLQQIGCKVGKKFRWDWKERAADADLSQEHDFLYSYVSRLLHAKPSSLSAVPNDLTADEILMFQAYTLLRIRVGAEQIESFALQQAHH